MTFPPQQGYQPQPPFPPQGAQGQGGYQPPQPPVPPQGAQGGYYNPYAQQPPQQGGYYNPYAQQPQQQGGYNPYAQQPQQQGGYNPYAQQPSQQGGYNPYAQQPSMPPQEEIVTQPIGAFGRESGFVTKVKIPAHSLDFNEQEFLQLLAGSISLTKDEKKKIIEAVPTLTQFQVTELMRILNEEKEKFSELDIKHKEQLDVLQEQHKREWEELEEEMTAVDMQAEEAAQLAQARQMAQMLQQNGGMPPKV